MPDEQKTKVYSFARVDESRKRMLGIIAGILVVRRYHPSLPGVALLLRVARIERGDFRLKTLGGPL